MRKYIILLLILLLSLAGCNTTQAQDDSIYFYFYSVSALNDQSENVIFSQPVTTDMSGMSIKDIITKYLQGADQAFIQPPFMPGTTVISVSEATDNLIVTLSNDCAAMSQLELTIAGSCLARTLFQFTQAQAVTIQTPDGFSYLDEELTFTRNSIILTDELIPQS